MKKSLENVEEVINRLEDVLSHSDGGETLPDSYVRKLSPILSELDNRFAVLREKVNTFQTELEKISRRVDDDPSRQ